MFACSVCEGSDYEIVNGFYYCSTCSTLSQDHHVQEVGEVETSAKASSLRRVRGDKKSTITRKRGRPWTIYEGYQCIILAQCDALISLGANRDLKDIVYTLWANYLSKLKIAFNKEEQVLPDIVLKTGFGRRRELHGGTLEKPWNRVKRHKRRAAEAVDKTTRGSDVSDSDLCGESSTLMEDTVGSKRKRESDSESSSDSSSDEESALFIEETKQCPHIKKSPEWMDMKRTVVFCYMGLQISNPEILLVQLLRWIFEGKVPFMSTSHLLNDDMVLSQDDRFLFLPCVLSVQNVVTEVDKMVGFLSLAPDFFPTPKLNIMIMELVNRLHLPDELQAVCLKLLRKVVYLKPKSSLCGKMEFVAMEYIALSLKMIFGLDDSTEHQLSEYSEEAQKAIGSEGNVFVWEKWRSYQVRKEKTNFDLYQDFCEERKYKYQNLDKILESCKNFHREDRRVCVSIKYETDKHHKSTMEGLTNPMKMATSNSKIREESHADETLELEQKFTESTLNHILKPDSFKANFEDNLDESSWEVLKHHRETILEKLVYSTYCPENEQLLDKKRPNSYLWLMHFLSNFVNCQTENLDKAVIALEIRLRRVAKK